MYMILKKISHTLIDQNNPIAKGLTSKDVVTVFTDSKNNLWVGTWNSGFLPRKWEQKNFKYSN